MAFSLRSRILLTLLPLAALVAILGGAGVALLQRVGGSVDGILRENYDSVIYMVRLKEAVGAIDSSFAFALAGADETAHAEFEKQWRLYDQALEKEQHNVTVPGEEELVARLAELTARYRKQGTEFYRRKMDDPGRRQGYEGPSGLKVTYENIKEVADKILFINQTQMEKASQNAHATASDSLVGLCIGLTLGIILACGLAWRTVQAILQPIRAVTHSARGIRAGNLDQLVPVMAHDELGELAKEFNAMARQLRQYRQTDYARLLRAQRTSQATIDSFPDPVLVVDPEGTVEMANPAAQRIFGVEGKSGNQPSPGPWIPPEALRGPLKETLEHQRPYLPEEFARAVPLRVAEKDYSFLPHILPICDPYGFTLGAAILLHDVTRFRLLDQMKSDLVATASHELKTPLTSIRLAHHLLLEEAVGPLTSKQTELLLDARDNSERLLAVVNNLLDLARLEQGRENLELRQYHPHALLQSAADRARPRSEDKGIALIVDGIENGSTVPVFVDADRLGHALNNLLDNAITYTDRGGSIKLSVQAVENQVELSIADTGVGIEPRFLPHVFERFFRVSGRARGAGTGLGLAIVREIVLAHGGSITCESQPGVGTTFRIRLPPTN